MSRSTAYDPARARRAERLLPALLATCMSAFVALVVTGINTGVDAGLAERWLRAWAMALPAAIAAAYVFRPLAWRVALVVVRCPPLPREAVNPPRS